MTSPPTRPTKRKGTRPRGEMKLRKGDEQVRPRPPQNPVASNPTGPPIHLDPVLIEGTWYERRGMGQREYVLVPSIEGTEGAAEIPERIIRFAGYPQTVEILIRQQNRFLATPPVPGIAGPGPLFVGGVTQWSLQVDGALVYCPATPARTATLALIDAQSALQRLALHPVRWQDPEDWQNRACYFQGVPCRVYRFSPQLGEVLLLAEPGHHFPPSWISLEAGSEDTHATEALADILYSPVWWDRERSFDSHGRSGLPGPTPGPTPEGAPAPPPEEADTHE